MASPWKIGERGGPSTRGYMRALAEWHAQRSKFMRRVLDTLQDQYPEMPNTLAASQIAQMSATGPRPPTVDDITAANAAAARQSARIARRSVPPSMLSTAGLVGTADELLGVDLILGGVEVEALNAWAADGLSYVNALPDDRAPILGERLVERVNAGDRWESIRSTVAEEMGVQGRHLDLIAQDQVAKLNGRITQELQSAAGITHFTWRTSQDGRVRESHDAVADQVWPWSTGAPNVGFYGESGFPGQAGRCRCTAEAVIPPEVKTDSAWYPRRNRGRGCVCRKK